MQRIQSLDLARGLTVFFMPAVHTVMLYSHPSVRNSIAGIFLAFIAEGPGAQLFMLIMGCSVIFSTRIGLRHTIQRTITLWAAAYSLNLLKFVPPTIFGWTPFQLMQEFHLKDCREAIRFFMMMGDILHFAALAYPIIYLVSRLKNYQWWAILFAAAIMLLSPLLWDVKSPFIFVNYLLRLTGGHPPEVFFPLFPWLTYPVTGLALGYWLKCKPEQFVFRWTGWIGIIFVCSSLLFPPTKWTEDWPCFYRTGLADTMFHLGFILVWVSVFHWMSTVVPHNFIFRLLCFCSRNITIIYFVQWILICWCLRIAGYQGLGPFPSFIWALTTTIVSFLCAWLIGCIYERKKNL